MKQVLYKPNQSIDEVYFPENSVICLMTVMANGDPLETGTVGLEGASWISASIDDLDVEMRENEHFRDLLTQYSHALLIHSMRMIGCTGLHSLHQRCARWILTTLDRVSEDRFSVTHEFLAMLLGVSRPSVSVVIEDFQKKGILRAERGGLVIGSREELLRVFVRLLSGDQGELRTGRSIIPMRRSIRIR